MSGSPWRSTAGSAVLLAPEDPESLEATIAVLVDTDPVRGLIQANPELSRAKAYRRR
jgi:hypothetical protein